jgi:DNA repair exonuclease SbcCD ATPase subunit
MSENDIEEDNGQFKMRLDDDMEDLEVTSIPASVDEMRLEKINTRVTIISILIPVLIAIVLVIAYLDIKKRVVRTEDEGSMSFQNLSADLESRFSSLSLRQAKLEEQMNGLSDRNNKALARIEVNLKKLDETTKALPKNLTAKEDLKAAMAGVEKKVNNIAGELEESQGQLSASIEKWNSEMAQLRTALTEAESQLTGLTDKTASIEKAKMDKPAMELAMGVEAIKIKQALKSTIDELSGKLNRLEKRVESLKNQSAPPRPSPAPVPGITPEPKLETPDDQSDAGIMEETINQ